MATRGLFQDVVDKSGLRMEVVDVRHLRTSLGGTECYELVCEMGGERFAVHGVWTGCAATTEVALHLRLTGHGPRVERPTFAEKVEVLREAFCGCRPQLDDALKADGAISPNGESMRDYIDKGLAWSRLRWEDYLAAGADGRPLVG